MAKPTRTLKTKPARSTSIYVETTYRAKGRGGKKGKLLKTEKTILSTGTLTRR